MVCQVCTSKSGYYSICKDCNELKEKGLVKKCDACGKWMKSTKPLCYERWKTQNLEPQANSKIKVGERNRLISIYQKALRQAWEDGKITKDEEKILGQLKENMEVTDKEHTDLEKNIKKEVETAIEILKKIEDTKHECLRRSTQHEI